MKVLGVCKCLSHPNHTMYGLHLCDDSICFSSQNQANVGGGGMGGKMHQTHADKSL